MTTTLNAGSILQGGRYKILGLLGQGGFGITYLGIQSGLERKVAIKEFYMKEFCARDAENSRVTIGTEGARQMVERFRDKFLNEARKLAQLNHAHIVRVIDVFQENDTAYYVMEYAEGGTLSGKVKSRGPLPEAVVVRYGLEVGSALQYIHDRRMNHLDIKPGNIMLNEKGETVVIDFGMSKHYDAKTGNETSTTPVGISDGYAPMEQYRPGGVGEFSPQTDIYALGATLFYLLTGIKPPSASDVFEDGLPIEHMKSNSVSTKTINVIAKAMKPSKKDRYATAEAFLADLEGHNVATNDDEDTVMLVKVENSEEFQQKAREEAMRREAERQAREAAARQEAERQAREAAARQEAERQAREAAARQEAERQAREAAARQEAERQAREAAARQGTSIASPQKGGGKGKLYAALGVAGVIVIGAAIAISTMGGKDSTKELDGDSTAVVEVAVPDSVIAQSITLDHGHATKRSFVYSGPVDANGIPSGKGSAEYPATKDCSSCKFDGNFVNGLPNEGALVFSSGVKYQGTFDEEGAYKEGDMTDKEGYTFKGTFKNGNPYNGTWYTPQGAVDGKVVNGVDQ